MRSIVSQLILQLMECVALHIGNSLLHGSLQGSDTGQLFVHLKPLMDAWRVNFS
jgi:hypothetical protein